MCKKMIEFIFIIAGLFSLIVCTWGLAISNPILTEGPTCGKQMYIFMEAIGWFIWGQIIVHTTYLLFFCKECKRNVFDRLFKLDEYKIIYFVFIAIPIFCYLIWFIQEFYKNEKLYRECNNYDATLANIIVIEKLLLEIIYWTANWINRCFDRDNEQKNEQLIEIPVAVPIAVQTSVPTELIVVPIEEVNVE